MIPYRCDPELHPVVLSAPGRFPPLPETHPLTGSECPACGDALVTGDVVALVLVGRAHGAGWTAGSVAVHEACSRAPAPAVSGLVSITCPQCAATSYHPEDVRQGYCSRCHWWTSDDPTTQTQGLPQASGGDATR